MRKAPSIKLTREERDELSKTARRHTGAMRDTLRARIILLAVDGLKNQEIAKTLGTSGNAVGKWRRRFVEKGITGLNDDPRPGRRRLYGPEKIEEIVKKTIEEKPSGQYPLEHAIDGQGSWRRQDNRGKSMESSSTRASSGKTLKLSYDKHFTSKLKDVITLFMNHPEKALVLGVDEKSQI